jgi:hypothetical protein
MNDVYDSEFYQNFIQKETKLVRSISLSLNTDGVQTHKSGKGVWPIFGLINELPYHERIKKENILLLGMWNDSKPNMSLFFQPLVEFFQKNSFDLKIENTILKNRKILFYNLSLDIPAKSKVLGMNGHAGYCSCNFCLTTGIKDGAMYFGFESENNLIPRTRKRTVEELKKIKNLINFQSQIGIKEESIFWKLNSFSLGSACIDDLHTLYLGVVQQLIGFLFDSENHKEEFYVKKQAQDEIDQFLFSFKFPSSTTFRFQSISKKNYWKGKDYYYFSTLFGKQ